MAKKNYDRKEILANKKSLQKASPDFIAELRQKAGGKFSDQQLSAVCAIARKASDDEWVEFVTNGTQPVIKLAPREMEALRGGLWGIVEEILHWCGACSE